MKNIKHKIKGYWDYKGQKNSYFSYRVGNRMQAVSFLVRAASKRINVRAAWYQKISSDGTLLQSEKLTN